MKISEVEVLAAEGKGQRELIITVESTIAGYRAVNVTVDRRAQVGIWNAILV